MTDDDVSYSGDPFLQMQKDNEEYAKRLGKRQRGADVVLGLIGVVAVSLYVGYIFFTPEAEKEAVAYWPSSAILLFLGAIIVNLIMRNLYYLEIERTQKQVLAFMGELFILVPVTALAWLHVHNFFN